MPAAPPPATPSPGTDDAPKRNLTPWYVAGALACALVVGAVMIDGSTEFAMTGIKRGLVIEDVAAGSGVPAERGDEVTVRYRGTLPDGTPIDGLDLNEQNRSHRFFIGDATVITGLDDGVVGMRRGGVRKLTIPPNMHFGDEGYAGVIPPNTHIVLEVELIEVRSGFTPMVINN